MASLTNSTFVGNIAYRIHLSQDGAASPTGSGGAIVNASNSTLNLSNCTVTANFAESAGGVASGVNSGSTLNIKSTIIAGNYAGNFFGAAPDVYGPFVSKGFNLIGKKDGSTGFNEATDKKGTIKAPLDPKLDPLGLRSNGGPTQTVALLSGSPAIDKGTSVTIAGTTLTTDQRGSGFPRLHDNGSITNTNGGDGTDIGAFELQTP